MITVLVATTLAVMITFTAVTQMRAARANEQTEAKLAAVLIERDARGPLYLGDRSALAEAFGALHVRADIGAACLYDATGSIVGRHEPTDVACPTRAPEIAAKEALRRELRWADRPIGTLDILANEAAIRAAIVEAVVPLLLLGLVAFLVISITGRRFARQLTDPLKHLTASARALSRGEFGERMPAEGPGEVRDLAETFNRVIEALLSARGELESELAERRRAQEALADADALLRNIVDLVPYLIFATRPDGTILFANRAVADAYGTTPSALIDGTFAARHAGPRPDGLLFADAARPGVQSAEVWFDARERGLRRFIVSRVPFDQSGTPVAPRADLADATLVVAMDVTEERRLEVQLQFAQRLEVVGTLAGGIAHDFNNLLTPILGYATLLMDRDLPADVASKVKAIHGASLKARELVQQILTFSRQRNEPSEKQRVDLRAIVDDALHLMRATIPSSIEIHLESDATGLDIDANAGQIHQIVVNLLANSAQAIRGARGRITIGLSLASAADVASLDDRPSALAPHGYAVLTVKDDGIGMPPAVQSRIFEPFFTTKTVGQGSGLGLSVVRGIVTAHRGAIAVDSREGDGATFRIFLPAAAAAHEGRAAARCEPSRGDERVMLVDDDGAVVRATKDLLESLGYRVKAFTQAGTALEQFRRDRAGFDVIVTDNLMPGMTGVELAAEVRQIDAEIPIVLMTGFVDDAAECNPAISLAIMKPVSGQELSSGIRRAMRPRAAA